MPMEGCSEAPSIGRPNTNAPVPPNGSTIAVEEIKRRLSPTPGMDAQHALSRALCDIGILISAIDILHVFI